MVLLPFYHGSVRSTVMMNPYKGPSTNVMRTLGFYTGDYSYGLGQVLLIQVLGPSGNGNDMRSAVYDQVVK